MIGMIEHDVDAELGFEGEYGPLVVVAVAVGGSMRRRAVAAVRLAADRDSETARECEGGHEYERGECAAHDDTSLRRCIGCRAALLDGVFHRLADKRPPTAGVPLSRRTREASLPQTQKRPAREWAGGFRCVGRCDVLVASRKAVTARNENRCPRT
jgi:hypothetical protein